MKKVLFISMGIQGHDGRQSELINVMSRIGEVDLVAPFFEDSEKYNIKGVNNNIDLKIKNREKRSSPLFYLIFFGSVLLQALREKYDIVFVDDFQTSICALAIKVIRPKSLYIQDCREFYYDRKMPGLGRFLTFFEKVMIKKSDVVIAANRTRADMMSILYGTNAPLVFENIRTLSTSRDKFSSPNIDSSQPVKIISTGGCSLERGTLNVIKAIARQEDFHLTIVGKGGEKDYKIINDFIKENDIKNVFIMERVPVDDLLNIMLYHHVGIVEYHFKDLNNYFCASGKIYEYLSIGMPVLTTTNPPLINLSQSYPSIVPVDDWHHTFKSLRGRFPKLKEIAEQKKSGISVEKNRESLYLSISEKIRESRCRNEKI